MSGVNKVIIVGNLGGDPELKQFQDGGLIANFTVATSEKWTDKQGEKKEETEWHKVSFGGKLAELCRDYIRKGTKVYVEGKLKTRKWKDKDGKDCYATEVKGAMIQILTPKGVSDIPDNSSPQNDHAAFTDDDIPF